jgi:hypothetical protein
VRIRTVLAFSTGLALGAGGVYLLDPELGAARRRDAATRARARAADEARRRLTQVRAQAGEVTRELRHGYATSRGGGGEPPAG